MTTLGSWNCSKYLVTDIHPRFVKGGGNKVGKSHVVDTIARGIAH